MLADPTWVPSCLKISLPLPLPRPNLTLPALPPPQTLCITGILRENFLSGVLSLGSQGQYQSAEKEQHTATAIILCDRKSTLPKVMMNLIASAEVCFQQVEKEDETTVSECPVLTDPVCCLTKTFETLDPGNFCSLFLQKKEFRIWNKSPPNREENLAQMFHGEMTRHA